jgi:RsiW-degrading membrane proteinase PrsW (M82 family)
MLHLIYIILGLAPSTIWLLFFLRKDSHPEPNRMILKIFFYGMLIAIPAALIEIVILKIVQGNWIWIKTFPFLFFVLYNFLGVALIEEFLKYLVIKQKTINNPEFDEPLDAMLYMIIAALGFAALENIFVLLPGEKSLLFLETISVISLRFIGATFLHALCSGLTGFFLALSFFETKKRLRLIILGLGIATLLHGLYNLSIIKTGENFYFILIPIIILIGLGFFISFGFRKAKKMASVCKIL